MNIYQQAASLQFTDSLRRGPIPRHSKTGIAIMPVNLPLENDTDPVIWRGPILGGTVKQFWTDVISGDWDILFIDVPPGTGDISLTVFQSIPVDGILIVTSPQELVSMVVSKALKMAEMMHIPLLGLVENLSYFHCPDNGKNYKIFGESHIEVVTGAAGSTRTAAENHLNGTLKTTGSVCHEHQHHGKYGK